MLVKSYYKPLFMNVTIDFYYNLSLRLRYFPLTLQESEIFVESCTYKLG